MCHQTRNVQDFIKNIYEAFPFRLCFIHKTTKASFFFDKNKIFQKYSHILQIANHRVLKSNLSPGRVIFCHIFSGRHLQDIITRYFFCFSEP